MTAWYSKQVNKTGKRSLVFSPKAAEQPDDPVEISCGQCIGCRIDRSKQWATRCVHEASLYENNCFITLTFSPEHLEQRENPWSLDVRDWQLFMKRLRKKFGSKIRFFHCGEYGDKNGRPHYHACLFNFDFPDKVLWKETNGYRLYISESLSDLWPYGFSTIGDVTFESAAYVARYIMKKITGELAETHYTYMDETTGELHSIKPEYITMSRRPGLATDWYKKYKTDLYPSDFITIQGRKLKVPKFYDKKLELEDIETYDEIKERRKITALDHHENNTYERLQVREQITKLKLDRLPRNHDED
jgi:hypothetical protein